MKFIELQKFGDWSVILRQDEFGNLPKEPYMVVCNAKVKNRKITAIGSCCSYFDNLFNAVNAARTLAGKMSYYRLEEIASKSIQKLIEDEPYSTIQYLEDEVEMEPDEFEYFGITFKNTGVYYDDDFLCMSLKGYEEDE